MDTVFTANTGVAFAPWLRELQLELDSTPQPKNTEAFCRAFLIRRLGSAERAKLEAALEAAFPNNSPTWAEVTRTALQAFENASSLSLRRSRFRGRRQVTGEGSAQYVHQLWQLSECC